MSACGASGRFFAWILLLAGTLTALADDFAALVSDRTAIERVYYQHRTGTKPRFEEVLPREAIEKLVQEDLRKETVLKKVYRVEIAPAEVEAEQQRIDRTTRAPETLKELKAALGNDSSRFAHTVVKPLLVKNALLTRFQNDDALHVAERRQSEAMRAQLLSAKTNGASVASLVSLLQQQSNRISEVVWQLGARTEARDAATTEEELEIRRRFGPDAKILSPGANDRSAQLYFEDLPDALRRVLSAQLRRAGDVSAVIETPESFALYLAKEKTATILAAVVFIVPKRSYEQWLIEQSLPERK